MFRVYEPICSRYQNHRKISTRVYLLQVGFLIKVDWMPLCDLPAIDCVIFIALLELELIMYGGIFRSAYFWPGSVPIEANKMTC